MQIHLCQNGIGGHMKDILLKQKILSPQVPSFSLSFLIYNNKKADLICLSNRLFYYKSGAEGFEPPNAWTKTRCLTTWLRPINWVTYSILSAEILLSIHFFNILLIKMPKGACFFCKNNLNLITYNLCYHW